MHGQKARSHGHAEGAESVTTITSPHSQVRERILRLLLSCTHMQILARFPLCLLAVLRLWSVRTHIMLRVTLCVSIASSVLERSRLSLWQIESS